MILVDSSAWIEYYRPQGQARAQAAVAEAITSDQVAVNGILQTEIVGFASSREEYRKLRSDFRAFHWLELTEAVFERAAQLGVALRALGVTVPATDLIIAACAMEAKATLFHLDQHFVEIARRCNLLQQDLRQATG